MAVYLEYFAKPGRITDLIEVNINNLAAVPSIVFGLLGLSVFWASSGCRVRRLCGRDGAGLDDLTIIIATRYSCGTAIYSGCRTRDWGLADACLDVLPLAAPGILTGTIIGMAQALGETAPLIMIGMVAFIVDVPDSLTTDRPSCSDFHLVR